MEPNVIDGVLKALACDLCSIKNLAPSVLAAAMQVREANFSFNALTGDGLGGLASFTSMTTLILDNNDLSSLATLPELPSLETLWLNNNNLADIEEVVSVLKKKCQRLKYLSLLRNPCCPNDLTGRDEAEYRRYRIYLRYSIPSLTNLDSSRITDEEVADAAKSGRFQRTAVHKIPNNINDQVGDEVGGQLAAGGGEEDLFERHSMSTMVGSDSGSFSSSSFTTFAEKKAERRTGNKLCEGNRFIKDDAL